MAGRHAVAYDGHVDLHRGGGHQGHEIHCVLRISGGNRHVTAVLNLGFSPVWLWPSVNLSMVVRLYIVTTKTLLKKTPLSARLSSTNTKKAISIRKYLPKADGEHGRTHDLLLERQLQAPHEKQQQKKTPQVVS